MSTTEPEYQITGPIVSICSLGVGILLVFVPFLVVNWQHGKKVYKRYNTISAYCADIVANPTGNRFILIATLVIGLSLASLHIQEFQSRQDNLVVLYAVELSACLGLPLVGIFHTDGKGANKYWIACKSCHIPIGLSVAVHYITALYFMFAMNITNFYYAVMLIGKSKSTATELTAPAIAIIVLICLAALCFVLFFVIQVCINLPKFWKCLKGCCYHCKRCDKYCKCRCTCDKPAPPTGPQCQFCEKNDPQRSICQHCGVDANWVAFSHNDTNWFINALSFWSEFALLLLTTLAALLGTLRRNNQVPWLQ